MECGLIGDLGPELLASCWWWGPRHGWEGGSTPNGYMSHDSTRHHGDGGEQHIFWRGGESRWIDDWNEQWTETEHAEKENIAQGCYNGIIFNEGASQQLLIRLLVRTWNREADRGVNGWEGSCRCLWSNKGECVLALDMLGSRVPAVSVKTSYLQALCVSCDVQGLSVGQGQVRQQKSVWFTVWGIVDLKKYMKIKETRRK